MPNEMFADGARAAARMRHAILWGARNTSAYDFGSIMHYGRKAFPRNGKDTIRPRVNGVGIGQRDGLSRGDQAAIRAMCRGQSGLEGDDRWATSYEGADEDSVVRFLLVSAALAGAALVICR